MEVEVEIKQKDYPRTNKELLESILKRWGSESMFWKISTSKVWVEEIHQATKE